MGLKLANPRGYYQDHYAFKKIRLQVIQESKGKCKGCGRVGCHIHHFDGDQNNEAKENLVLLCAKCHKLMHSGGDVRTSKYARIYGKSIRGLAEEFGVGEHKIYYLAKRGWLLEFVKTGILPPRQKNRTEFSKRYGMNLRELMKLLGKTNDGIRRLEGRGELVPLLIKLGKLPEGFVLGSSFITMKK